MSVGPARAAVLAVTLLLLLLHCHNCAAAVLRETRRQLSTDEKIKHLLSQYGSGGAVERAPTKAAEIRRETLVLDKSGVIREANDASSSQPLTQHADPISFKISSDEIATPVKTKPIVREESERSKEEQVYRDLLDTINQNLAPLSATTSSNQLIEALQTVLAERQQQQQQLGDTSGGWLERAAPWQDSVCSQLLDTWDTSPPSQPTPPPPPSLPLPPPSLPLLLPPLPLLVRQKRHLYLVNPAAAERRVPLTAATADRTLQRLLQCLAALVARHSPSSAPPPAGRQQLLHQLYSHYHRWLRSEVAALVPTLDTLRTYWMVQRADTADTPDPSHPYHHHHLNQQQQQEEEQQQQPPSQQPFTLMLAPARRAAADATASAPGGTGDGGGSKVWLLLLVPLMLTMSAVIVWLTLVKRRFCSDEQQQQSDPHHHHQQQQQQQQQQHDNSNGSISSRHHQDTRCKDRLVSCCSGGGAGAGGVGGKSGVCGYQSVTSCEDDTSSDTCHCH